MIQLTTEVIAVGFAIILQTVGVIVWATRLEGRVNHLTAWMYQHAQILERVTRLEERVANVQDTVGEIREIVSRDRA